MTVDYPSIPANFRDLSDEDFSYMKDTYEWIPGVVCSDGHCSDPRPVETIEGKHEIWYGVCRRRAAGGLDRCGKPVLNLKQHPALMAMLAVGGEAAVMAALHDGYSLSASDDAWQTLPIVKINPRGG